MKLINKSKTAENNCITRLFGKKKKTRVSYQNFGLYLVQVAGLEPVQYCYHWNLNFTSVLYYHLPEKFCTYNVTLRKTITLFHS